MRTVPFPLMSIGFEAVFTRIGILMFSYLIKSSIEQVKCDEAPESKSHLAVPFCLCFPLHLVHSVISTSCAQLCAHLFNESTQPCTLLYLSFIASCVINRL